MRPARVVSAPRAMTRAAASQVASCALRHSLSGSDTRSYRSAVQERQVEVPRAGTLDRALVAGVRMSHDPARRIVPQHALDAARGGGRAVAHDDDAGVLRVADADSAAQRNGPMPRQNSGRRYAGTKPGKANASLRPASKATWRRLLP